MFAGSHQRLGFKAVLGKVAPTEGQLYARHQDCDVLAVLIRRSEQLLLVNKTTTASKTGKVKLTTFSGYVLSPGSCATYCKLTHT